jgi:hypothetical protein
MLGHRIQLYEYSIVLHIYRLQRHSLSRPMCIPELFLDEAPWAICPYENTSRDETYHEKYVPEIKNLMKYNAYNSSIVFDLGHFEQMFQINKKPRANYF